MTKDKTIPIPSSLLIISASALVLGYYAWYSCKNNKQQSKHKRSSKDIILPERWTAIGKVSKLLIYPLKSGYYNGLKVAKCDFKGMRENDDNIRCRSYTGNILHDRQFVLFDKTTDKFITSKINEKITLIEAIKFDQDHIEFYVHNDETIESYPLDITLVKEKGVIDSFKMHFNEIVNAYDCGDEVSDWFSKYLYGSEDRNIRLGMFCNYDRTITNSWDKYTEIYPKFTDDDTGRFSDIASYMICNEESINDLNCKVPKNNGPFNCHYFRPNILIKNCIPYEEDNWDWLKIGDVIFRIIKPCTRCIAITINPETGLKNKDLEPMRTLRTYRRLGEIDERAKHLEGRSPVMGVYAGLYKEGVIRVDDIVFVSSNVLT